MRINGSSSARMRAGSIISERPSQGPHDALVGGGDF
jgi:hypothetical protein